MVRLVQHTLQMKNSRHFQVIPMDRKLTMRKDEIGIRVAIADRQLQISVTENDTVVIETDETLLAHILENILSKVVSYTPCGGQVEIVLTPDKIQIENFGVQVEEDILPHIFEPFVSGSHHKADSGASCHGLGMYIAAYYARKIGMKITIGNGSNCVMTVLYFNQ